MIPFANFSTPKLPYSEEQKSDSGHTSLNFKDLIMSLVDFISEKLATVELKGKGIEYDISS